MDKLSFEDWKNSMSFMVDDDFDNSFLGTIIPLTQLINDNCTSFSNKKAIIINTLDNNLYK